SSPARPTGRPRTRRSPTAGRAMDGRSSRCGPEIAAPDRSARRSISWRTTARARRSVRFAESRREERSMAPVVERIEINRSPEDVFAYLDDLSRHGEWDDQIVSTRVETD